MVRAFLKRRRFPVKHLKKVRCLILLRLILAALPALVFGVFTIAFSLQQDASDRASREQDQRQVDENTRRVTFKEYIDVVKGILLDAEFENNTVKSLLQIRAQTLTALQSLDPYRKRSVIVYLYENRLIRRDDTHLVDLRGANLNDLEFSKSAMDRCDLSFLYLPGIHAENIVFDSCSLTNAVFDDALLPRARFVASLLISSSFRNANLAHSTLLGNDLYGSDLFGANLSSSTIESGVFERVDLTNADLYRSTINDSLLYPLTNGGLAPNVFLNTRFPNGSFSAISGAELVEDGRAPADCPTNFSGSWSNAELNRTVELINASLIEQTVTPVIDANCFFRVNQENSIFKTIDVPQFSVLIDQNQGMFNLSVHVGLRYPWEQGQLSLMVYFERDGGSGDTRQSIIELIKNPSLFQFHSIIKPIPVKTKRIVILLSCAAHTNEDQFCLFDQVKLFIFQNSSPSKRPF